MDTRRWHARTGTTLRTKQQRHDMGQRSTCPSLRSQQVMDSIDLDCVIDLIVDSAKAARNGDSREIARDINNQDAATRERELTTMIQAIRYLAHQTGRWSR